MTSIRSIRPLALLLTFLVTATCLLAARDARAAEPAPAWSIDVVSAPTNFGRLSENNAAGNASYYFIVATNVGSIPTTEPFTITDTLPPGVEAHPIEFRPIEGINRSGRANIGYSPMNCSAAGQVVSCESTEPLPPGEAASMFVPVAVTDSAPAEVTNEVEVFGGGAPLRRATTTTKIDPAPAPEGFVDGPAGFDTNITAADGSTALLAGAHPFQFSTTVGFPSEMVFPGFEELFSVAEPKELRVTLPRGMYVDPNAIKKKCTEPELESDQAGVGCPLESQIGVATPIFRPVGPSVGVFPQPLYAMEPSPGYPAEFAFDAQAGVYIHLFGHVNSAGEYELAARVPNIAAKLALTASIVSLWGNPADPAHNWMRGGSGSVGCIGRNPDEKECTVEPSNRAALTLPADCSGEPLNSTAELATWVNPDVIHRASSESNDLEGNSTVVSGCNRLEYDPSIESQPTTSNSDSPTGLTFDLHQRQNLEYNQLALAPTKDLEVALPAGLALNPAGANGLAACTEDQIGYQPSGGKIRFSEGAQSCPDSAKIGTVDVNTPLVDHELPGAAYVAQPYANPFHSLLAIYLAIEDEETGLVSKLAGKVTADPQTGQLTASFTENPELPIEDVELNLFEGPGAVLSTPLACGAYTTTTSLVPWTTPEGVTVHPSDTFRTTGTASGSGSCPSGEAAAPKSMAFSAGTKAPLAGAYSPFSLRIARPDGSQRISDIETSLPEGLLGKLAGVQDCPPGGIALAVSRETPEMGKVEQQSPSCPAASEVGTVQVTAGSGITPIPVSGHVYLAGPYKGAPISLVVIVPAVAGPFDLGTVVNRVALDVGTYDARIQAVSDPLPTILDGIPLNLRSIDLELGRPGFTLNPTNCEAKSIAATVATRAGQSVSLQNRFQVGECARLAFKPKLKLRLKGATKRTGHPALKAVLTMPGGGANIARAKVGLPHGEFLDNANIGTVCTQPQLQSQTCPAASIYGRAKAWTPLLDRPLEGPVYLGAGFGHKLPDLVADLNGQIRVLVHGKIDTDRRGGIRNTFEAVPDAPVSKFVLEMRGGKKKGLLVNSENICRRAQQAEVNFVAQNGKARSFKAGIANDCKSAKKKGKKKGKRGGR